MPSNATRLLDSLEVEFPAFSHDEPLQRWHAWMRNATGLRVEHRPTAIYSA